MHHGFPCESPRNPTDNLLVLLPNRIRSTLVQQPQQESLGSLIRSVTLLVGLFVFANVALSFFLTGCTTPTRPVAVAALPPKALPRPHPAAAATVPAEVQKLKPN